MRSMGTDLEQTFTCKSDTQIILLTACYNLKGSLENKNETLIFIKAKIKS